MEGKRDLSDVIFLLTICGSINPHEGLWGHVVTFYQSLLVLITIIGACLSSASVYLSGLKESLPRYAFFCCFGYLVSLVGIFFLSNRKETEQTIYALRSVVQERNEPWHIEQFKKMSRALWIILNGLILIFITFIIGYFLIPWGYDLYLVIVDSNSTQPFTMPLPINGLLGSGPPVRNIYFYTLSVFFMVWSSCAMIIATGYYGFLFISITYLCNELKIISANIQNWPVSDPQNMEEAIGALKVIITEHQRCLEIYINIRDVIGFPFLSFSIVGPISTTLFMYTTAVQFNKNLLVTAVNAFCSISMISILFVSCLAGEILQMNSLELFETLCNIPWYEMNPNLRKYLNMVLRQAVKPLAINYRRRAYLNLQTFAQMMHSCYSYLMLLNSMK